MLGLAFVYPTSLSAQKDKKKKEKKELIWELPEPSGDPTIDGYLLSCDTLYHKISTYRDSLSHYKYQEASFSVGGKNYLFKCMIDSVNNQFLSYGMGRWQVAQGIMTGAEIILDATSLSLNTASAALALPNLKLKAHNFLYRANHLLSTIPDLTYPNVLQPHHFLSHSYGISSNQYRHRLVQ
jgi:hypothetical protein